MLKTFNSKEFADHRSYDFRIWVSKDGKDVFKGRKDDRLGRPLNVYLDYEGYFVLSEEDDGIRINIADVVIENFCPPHPNDGKEYMINWKDGNKTNNDYTNLEWVPYQYRNSTAEKEILYRQNNLIDVHKDGTIWCRQRKLNIIDQTFDDDVWLRWPERQPYCTLDYQNRLPIDKLMADCGYVQGDPASFATPVILHKDNNYKNCASDNLEWTDLHDQRYHDFLVQRLSDRCDVYRRENGHQRPPHDKFVSECDGNTVLIGKLN